MMSIYYISAIRILLSYLIIYKLNIFIRNGKANLMSFYHNLSTMKDSISEVSPITWGDFKIIGFKESHKDSDPISACYHKLQNQAWYDLMLGILTNNINLVKENINKVQILKSVPVVIDDPNKSVKLFSVKEAKKYSSPEIQNLIREKYDNASINEKWFNQEELRNSRGSYFSTVPSFDGIQLAKIKPSEFKLFKNPFKIGQVRIIGSYHANYHQMSLNYDYYAKLNLNLLRAVILGDFDTVKNIVESNFGSICTTPSFITEDLNKLNIDLPFEAMQLGFTQIAQYLENVETAQNQGNALPFDQSKESNQKITLGNFVRSDAQMETEN